MKKSGKQFFLMTYIRGAMTTPLYPSSERFLLSSNIHRQKNLFTFKTEEVASKIIMVVCHVNKHNILPPPPFPQQGIP